MTFTFGTKGDFASSGFTFVSPATSSASSFGGQGGFAQSEDPMKVKKQKVLSSGFCSKMEESNGEGFLEFSIREAAEGAREQVRNSLVMQPFEGFLTGLSSQHKDWNAETATRTIIVKRFSTIDSPIHVSSR